MIAIDYVRIALECHLHLDGGVGFVPLHLEVAEAEAVDAPGGHASQRVRQRTAVISTQSARLTPPSNNLQSLPPSKPTHRPAHILGGGRDV